MEPRIEPVKGGVAAVGPGWAVVGQSEDDARRRFAEALREHETIESRPDPHPYPTERAQQPWRSPTFAQG